MVSIKVHSNIYIKYVPTLKGAAIRNAMSCYIVHRSADGFREALKIQWRRITIMKGDHVPGMSINILSRYSWLYDVMQRVQNLPCKLTGPPDLGRRIIDTEDMEIWFYLLCLSLVVTTALGF